jgi:leucyl/phenylalanyl-tRNA---protein transferase
MPPVEPPPTPWVFPDPTEIDDDVIAIGADLEPGTVLAAYRQGLFPMPVEEAELAWWSPIERGVLPLDGMRVSHSLRKSAKRFEFSIDKAYDRVVAGCADPSRPGGWISDAVKDAYRRLHDLGWVHSVEVWRDGRLAGGLYGVAIGGLFAGESMFHRDRDASKVALLVLVNLLDDGIEGRLLDVQWNTAHLASLGAVQIPRDAYLTRLRHALQLPLPALWR